MTMSTTPFVCLVAAQSIVSVQAATVAVEFIQDRGLDSSGKTLNDVTPMLQLGGQLRSCHV